MSRYTCPSKLITEAMVISGMSGRFPESDSTEEFADNLYNNVDLITEDDRRWPTGLFGINDRMGKLKDVNRLDGAFFGIHQRLSDTIEPNSRILLETTYEAIVDAGINPQTLRGSKTGVYIGYSSFGMSDGFLEDLHVDSQIEVAENMLGYSGMAKSLYANRISFVFDLKGPSLVIDTACSSSLVAFNTAMNDLRLGKCDQAIVGGTQVCLQPFTNQIFQVTQVNSADGIPKVWDEEADGYVRGESVFCFLLQRKSEAKRIYATVLNTGVNIDGHKKGGMFLPSIESQEELMTTTYKEANIDPLEVTYFEAHATGTKAGDTQEAKAIFNAYCNGRETPLPIGLLKSIIGHGEGASGGPAVVRVLLAYERECISGNLHLNNLKNSIKPFCPPLLPIKENMKYAPGIAGINNFGVGGVNAHLLVEPNYKTSDDNCLEIADTIPRIVNLCCRTEKAFNKTCEWIEANPEKVSQDFLALFAQTMRLKPSLNSSGMPYRGSLIIKQLADNSYEYKKQFSILSLKTQRPVWFVFPGLGGQWVGMAKALMPIKIFSDKIEECHQILQKVGFDLKHPLLSEDKGSMKGLTNKFTTTTAIEIALYSLMKESEIIPDGIIGHSFGETAAAYADGCLTLEEALLTAYYRGVVIDSDKCMPRGLMAAVGLSWKDAQSMCVDGTQVVCNNGNDSVVISGLEESITKVIEKIEAKDIFVRKVDSDGIPLHSQYMKSSAQALTEKLRNVIKDPKMRTKKWVSTAVTESETKEELKYASPEYFVHNLINPVYFYNKMKQIPQSAIVVEIGPHGLFSRPIKETIESVEYISLLKKDSNDTNLDMFLSSISKLYEFGLNPIIENLYTKVEWPVARGTPSISSLIQWDHSDNLFTRTYPDHYFRPTASDRNLTIRLDQAIKTHYPDHLIDGHIIIPATCYLMLAWQQLASYCAKPWREVPVVFEDVQFRRPIFLSETDPTKIKIKYFRRTGDFSIEENEKICCFGKIRTTDDLELNVQHLITDNNNTKDSELILNKKDIYKDFKPLGFDHGPIYQRLQTIRTYDLEKYGGEVEWDGNWITFVDALLQSIVLPLVIRKLMIPVFMKCLRCDPKVLFQAIDSNRVLENEDSIVQIDENSHDQVDLDNLEEKDIENFESRIEQGTFNEDEGIAMVEQAFNKKNSICKAILPYYVDTDCGIIVSNGIEIEGLMAIPIPRRPNTQELKLESYEFIANQESNAIEESDRNAISEYIKVCSSIVYKIRNNLELKDNDPNFSEDVLNKYLNNIKDEHILLKILNQIIKCVDENGNFDQNKIMEAIEDNDLSLDVINKLSTKERLIRPLIDIVSENNVPKKEIKVLEINATNCLLAKEVDNLLASFHIYPIDVDYSIAVKSIDSLPEDSTKESFKLIEWKASDSTLFPTENTSLDLIVYKDSYSLWELNTEKQLQQTFEALNKRGFLLSVFRYQLTEPEIALNQMNGKPNLKTSDLQKRIADYLISSKNVGFSLVSQRMDSIGCMAFLFRKVETIPSVPKKVNYIQIENNSMNWFQTLKEKINELKESEEKENVWLIANDSSINGIIGLINCLRLEPGGECFRCIFISDDSQKSNIDFNSKPFSDILSNDLAINVLKNGKLGTYRHLTLPEDYDKTESNEYYLNNTQLIDLSGLQWFSSKNLVSQKVNEAFGLINNDQVHCTVYMGGLNFKDVMIASGRVTSGIMSALTDCVIGTDFVGRRTDTGERIMGFVHSRGFATSVTTRDDLITTIPENWSMEEAVTLLSTYNTVWYGLIERAQLKRGESILIHSGAGGVGQAAINVCQYYGCDIFVTVGTEEKRKFLITEYNIPENRIFSSRDVQFKYEIKRVTKGKGVNIVVNSLTGDKMDASFECVADSGRYVEIGKYELQMNKEIGTASFLRNISFIGVFIDMQLFFLKESCKNFFEWLHQNSMNGMIKPINITVFEAEEAKNAFQYMTTGKHIGKIVIKIRDEENERKAINSIKRAVSLKTTTKTFFNPNKVYIITGGLGGFGLELIQWMLFLGARKFVLTSRYGVRTDYQKFVLQRLERTGHKSKYFESEIVVSTHDMNSIGGVEQLIRSAQELGPIGGVFHLAVVLNDSFIENQTIDKFNETIDSKSKSFENLDKISRDLCLDLDYFVVFSSVTCGKGNAGQSNYGFANSLCERICEVRRMDGLHGLAIQWGPIGDVGILSDKELSSLSAVEKQRMNSCLEVLDKLLQTDRTIVSSMIRSKRTIQLESKESKLANQMWQALGIDPKTTPNHLTLGEIGMESMFAVELQQGLEREYNIKVTLYDVKNITIGMMKDFEAGNKDKIKKFNEKVKSFRKKLVKVKFVIPSVTHTKLNNVTNGKPIYIVPPLEGLFASIEEFALKLDRPVIGLNRTKAVDNLLNVEDIGKYYINLLTTLEPKGDIDIIGYSHSALIAIEIYMKAGVDTLILIDTMSGIQLNDELISDEHLLDETFKSVIRGLPEEVVTKLKREIQTKTDITTKIAKMSEEIKEFAGRNLVSKDLDQILMNSYNTLKIFSNHLIDSKKNSSQMNNNSMKIFAKMRGKVLIIKPIENNENKSFEDLVENISKTYLLPNQDFNGNTDIKTIEIISIDEIALKVNDIQ